MTNRFPTTGGRWSFQSLCIHHPLRPPDRQPPGVSNHREFVTGGLWNSAIGICYENESIIIEQVHSFKPRLRSCFVDTLGTGVYRTGNNRFILTAQILMKLLAFVVCTIHTSIALCWFAGTLNQKGPFGIPAWILIFGMIDVPIAPYVFSALDHFYEFRPHRMMTYFWALNLTGCLYWSLLLFIPFKYCRWIYRLFTQELLTDLADSGQIQYESDKQI